MKNPDPNDRAIMASRRAESFAQTVLAWAKCNTRDLPWRKTKDPYKIIVAEVMLQRTKAEQVLPVYEPFLRQFPDFDSLCKASVTEIRESIISLGLEKRALGLKKLAEQLTNEYGGNVPCTRKELLELYGVGNYVANAVICHAFGIDALTVDANFARVLDRVFSLKPNHPAQKDKRVWAFAESLMPYARGKCRTLNLGILDLASAICTPRKPSCTECPLNTICDYGTLVLAEAGLSPRIRRSRTQSISRRT
jgi:A/G-specific adenine glycosylase